MHITKDIDRLLQEHNAEYVDMYEVGLSDEMMVAAIHYCSSDPKAILFRGDGDQDRPN